MAATTGPTGQLRMVLRLPLWLYRANLGWVLGNRFLRLHHVGRKTGKPREVVIEVVRHDRPTDSYVVACGFGPTASWYRNLRSTPDVAIDVGRRTLAVTAELLDEEASREEARRYARSHPVAARLIRRVFGYRPTSDGAFEQPDGTTIPFVSFRPRRA